jgi:hypothetical protein
MKITRRTKRAARAVYGLCLVDGALDADRVRTAARHLAGSERRGALALLAAFHRLVRLDRDRHSALVESATPLGDTMRDELRQRRLRRQRAGAAGRALSAPVRKRHG